MANQVKKNYVQNIREKLSHNPHVVVLNFSGTKHKKLEDFRIKLRGIAEDAPEFFVLKNSLFKIAFDQFNQKNKVLSAEDSEMLQSAVKGQAAAILTDGDWLSYLKAIKEFAKEEEGFEFAAGVLEGTVYNQDGLKRLADLPGKEELIASIIGSVRAPQQKLVYGLKFNAMKLVNVLKNAASKN